MGVGASSLSPDMPVCTLGEEVAARPGRGWPNRQSSQCPVVNTEAQGRMSENLKAKLLMERQVGGGVTKSEAPQLE